MTRPNPSTLFLSALCALLSAKHARAQAGTDLDRWQEQIETELSPSSPEFHDNRFRDAAADRVILFPTAETQPAGVYYVSGHDGVAWTRLGVSLTDDVQVGVSGAPVPWPTGAATVTYSILRSRFRLAVIGGTMNIVVVGGGGLGPPDALPPRRPPYHVVHGGFVGQLCFDRHCRSSGILGVHRGIELSWEEPITLPHAGFVIRVSEVVALLAEGALTRWQRERDYRDGWPLAPMEDWAALGLRLGTRTSRRFIGDVSLVAAHQPGEILLFPWVSITFRTDPIEGRKP